MVKSIDITIGNRIDKSQVNTEVSNDRVKITDWENEPSVMRLNDDLLQSKQYHDSMVRQIKEWRELLKVEGHAKPNVTRKGMSKIQPKLIRRQGEWRYSALTESFLSSEKLFNVDPRTWEDIDSARKNEILLNWQMNTKIRRVKFIDEYVRTCYDEGTVFVKVGWFRKSHMEMVERPVYSFVSIETEEELMMLQQAMELQVSNPRGYNEQVPEELKAAVDYTNENGVPVLAQPTVEFITSEEEVIDENKPTLEILDYNNLYIDPTCQGDINNARFAIISFETSKAELEEDGRYSNLELVNFSNNSPIMTPDHESHHSADFNFQDEPRKRIVAHEYWGYYDVHGDGTLTPIVATWIGNVMIRMEENPFPDQRIPVVAVPYMPLKKSVYGETDAELLKDNQNILGAISRGLIDSLGKTANGQRGIAKNLLDISNRRKFENGEDYEFNPVQNPRDGVIEHKFGEVSQSAIAILEMQNHEAESLTGVKAFTGGLSSDAYGKVATGIRGMLDAASKREMGILRRLAEGMTEIGNKIIAMNAIFLSEEEVVRVTNEDYEVIRREDLKGNFDLIVDISTPEVDEAKAQDLGFMLQTIGNNMDQKMRNIILSEIASLKRMPTLAHEIRNYEPQPDPLEIRARELEIERMELENRLLNYKMMDLESKSQLQVAKAREAGSNADLKDLDFVEQETGTKHARDMEKQKAQARGNQNLKVTEALLKPTKKEEQPGNVSAAIGFNRLSQALDDELSR